jgi:anti-anti-sigma factor
MSEKHATPWMEREDLGDLTVVRFRTRGLTEDDNTRELFDQLYALVEDMGRKNLLLNFDAVEYMASLALGKLVMLNKKIQLAGGWLGLCALGATVRQLFEVTHLNDLFLIYADEAQALQAVPVAESEVM